MALKEMHEPFPPSQTALLYWLQSVTRENSEKLGPLSLYSAESWMENKIQDFISVQATFQ